MFETYDKNCGRKLCWYNPLYRIKRISLTSALFQFFSIPSHIFLSEFCRRGTEMFGAQQTPQGKHLSCGDSENHEKPLETGALKNEKP
jgi:hypothetical protein